MLTFLNIFVAKLSFRIKENKNNSYKFLNKLSVPETTLSRDIRITSEVEKIFILCDLDEDGKLDYKELKQYI